MFPLKSRWWVCESLIVTVEVVATPRRTLPMLSMKIQRKKKLSTLLNRCFAYSFIFSDGKNVKWSRCEAATARIHNFDVGLEELSCFNFFQQTLFKENFYFRLVCVLLQIKLMNFVRCSFVSQEFNEETRAITKAFYAQVFNAEYYFKRRDQQQGYTSQPAKASLSSSSNRHRKRKSNEKYMKTRWNSIFVFAFQLQH